MINNMYVLYCTNTYDVFYMLYYTIRIMCNIDTITTQCIIIMYTT